MPQLKGVIKTPTGEPLDGATITLTSIHNRAGILKSVFSHVTTQNGEYDFPVLPGVYSVRLTQSTRRLSEIGVIRVYEDSTDGSLNDFLGATNIDLRPESLKKFEELAQQAQQSAGSAAGNARQTAQDVTAAATARDDAQRFAEKARQDATVTAENRKATAEDVKSTGKNAVLSGQRAQAAAGYARAAEQAKNDIDAALTGTLKTANHLSEIAAAGEKAQQKSRDNLGLKSAATMEAQSDIYDRTKGRLAIPGAFGFGRAFLPEDVIRFDTKSDFLAWVRNALPGEYSVAGRLGIIPDTRFEGVLSIRWTDARPETTEPRYRAKSLTFYGINGPIYHTRYCYWPISRLTDWVKINITTEDIIYRIVASSVCNRWGDPDIGGLIIAAYQGEADGDKVIRLVRGQSYRGSRLGPVGISVPSTPTGTHIAYPQFFITGCSEHSLPGSYCALSGVPDAHVSGAMPGLFIRTS
ncbi:tail fiber protein [Shigella sonnei]|nr:prophage tail fiber N-terminal domain-containing protein [Shigella sonnei]EJM5824601.1 prophage tail fiber N-terminal domain-containing protein [Escherichia coli]EJD8324633.1 prophage tail fiber N-terminal domain-containing protein [Shigella sonnei]EJH6177741.1 prophage tail fiber N-terminal domain-containing protein [Shigella sonnei]EJH7506161.1 prophage tail fiber N-terminal domain-containing protein [Shigella sonnei]EJI5909413.1 prophage tail fiber N-terminal domain-containing protein [S